MTETVTDRTPEALVAAFADGSQRIEAYFALLECGQHALPAVREGLRHGNWQVRRWCAMFLDQHADPESLQALIPLLKDPKALVRLWAVHSLSCDRCKPGESGLDAVPLLIDRIEHDESLRVRRMATAMLAVGEPDPRAVAVFKMVLGEEQDRKLRLHAENGLNRYRDAGLA